MTAGATPFQPCGIYTITNTTGTFGSSNILIATATANGTLTVTQVVLTVTAGSTNRAYGAPNPVFTVSYSGFVLSQTNTILSGAPSVTTSATTSSPGGNYAIVVTNGTLFATNYSFAFVNGVLTVNGGPVQLGGLVLGGGKFIFGWQSAANQTIRLNTKMTLRPRRGRPWAMPLPAPADSSPRPTVSARRRTGSSI